MNELQLISHQQPGLVSIDNFAEMKDALARMLERYAHVVYTEAALAEAKADKKELTRLRRDIDERRKEIKRAYLAPYNEFEAQIKELLAMVDAPLDEVKAFVLQMDEQEKRAKRAEIEGYFFQHAAALGDLARPVLDSPAFFDPKWLNKTTAARKWQTAVNEKIFAVSQDLNAIRASGLHAGALTARYLETLSTEGLEAFQSQLAAVSRPVSTDSLPTAEPAQDPSAMTLRLTGSRQALTQALELLDACGVHWEVLEDNRG